MSLKFSQKRMYVFFVILLSVIVTLPQVHPTPAQAQDIGGGRISYGESVQGSITVEKPRDEWGFRAKVGDSVSVRLTRQGELDYSVLLYDEFGLELGDWDWDYDARASVIDEVFLPASGVFTIVVSSRYNSTGNYTLKLDLVKQEDLPEIIEDGGTVEYDNRYMAHLYTDEDNDRWEFAGQRGDVVSLAAHPITNVECQIWLYDERGVQVAWSQWDYDNQANMINDFLLPTTGQYTVVVGSRYDQNGYYWFELKLDEQNDDDGMVPSQGGQIEFGQLVIGQITKQTPENLWAIEGEKGDLITINLKNVTYFNTPGLWLTRPGAEDVLAEGETVPNSDNRELQIWKFELPSSGTFTVTVGFRWGTDQSGYYELLVVKEGFIPTISDGGTISGGDTLGSEFTANNTEDEWTFQAESGQKVTILMKRLTGNLICDFEIFDPDGNSIGYSDPSSNRIDAELIELEVPANGTYTIIARPFARNQEGIYSISLIGASVRTMESTPSDLMQPTEPISLSSQLRVGDIQRPESDNIVPVYCDEYPSSNKVLQAGETIYLYKGWIAVTEEQVRDYIENVEVQITVDDQPIREDWTDFATSILYNSDWAPYYYGIEWYIPINLESGSHLVQETVHFKTRVSDGTDWYGPGEIISTCTFQAY